MIKPNNISLKNLKSVKETIAKHLCNINNLSLTTGILPDSIAIAKVTPVYKKRLKNLNALSIGPSLYSQMLIKEKQVGFQKKFPITHTIISLTDSIEKTMENNLFIYFEFSLIYKKHLIP